MSDFQSNPGAHPMNSPFPFEVNDLKALLDSVSGLAREFRSAQARLAEDRAGWSVLAILEEQGGRTVPEIARLVGTSRQNIQIVANRLEERGAIRFEKNPGHQRSDLAHLTLEGRDLLRLGAAAEKKLLLQAGGTVSIEETLTALGVLKKLRAAVSSVNQRQDSNAGKRASPGTAKPVEIVEIQQISTPAETTELPYNLL